MKKYILILTLISTTQITNSIPKDLQLLILSNVISNKNQNYTKADYINLIKKLDEDIINFQYSNNITQLHRASKYENPRAIEALIECKANIEAKTEDLELTPLHVAAQQNNVESIKVLLNNNASACAQNKYKSTPLHHAAYFSNNNAKKIISLLIKANKLALFARNDKGDIPLNIALFKNNKEAVNSLINYDMDNSESKIKEMVNIKNLKGETPLHYAAFHCKSDIISLLIDAKANLKALTYDIKKSPLHYAAENDNVNSIKTLLESVNKTKIENQAYLNCKSLNGFTPLHIAVLKNKKNAIECLLKYKADINNQLRLSVNSRYNGDTPLHTATRYKYIDIVILLLNNSANYRIRNKNNLTALALINYLLQQDINNM